MRKRNYFEIGNLKMINKYVFYRVFQIIEELEERIIKISQIQNVKYQKEISKMKLKYEIMARNQVNQRFSEMNEFLSEQQKEHEQDERKKADVTDAIQKDLAKRLQISRDELIAIKEQMRGNVIIVWYEIQMNVIAVPLM